MNINHSPMQDTTWTKEELLEMLLDEKPSRKLSLKEGNVEVQRIYKGNRAFVEKRYKGDLVDFNEYETQRLLAINSIQACKDKVASLTGFSAETEHRKQSTTSVIHTKWLGLDTDSWEKLSDNSFTQNIPALLAWVRGVLMAVYDFHKAGFVHCDLLPKNIAINYSKPDKNSFQIELDKIFIFDLEFCLTPQNKNNALPRDGWFDNKGKVRTLHYLSHSEWTLPYEIDEPQKDGNETIGKRTKSEPTRYKNPPFADLKRVDWGVDLFTLGTALHDFTNHLELALHEECKSNQEAYKYLCRLPSLLRSFNQLTKDEKENPRPHLPHREICAEIDALENECRKWGKPSWNYDWNKYRIQHTNAQTPWNTKRLTTGAILLLGLAGGGAWWAGQREKTPPAPMKVVEEVKPTPTPAPPPPPTAAELYQQATSRMQQTAWYKGEAKPTDTDLQWVRETQRLAADNVVDAQFQHALLSCRGIAAPAIAHDTQQCGKWLAQVLVATPPVHADQENNRRDAAINYFSSLVWNSDPYLPDSHFARSLQPGLVAWKEHSPTLKMALAYTVACYQQPADGEKARQMVAEVITKNPNKDMLKLVKNIQTLLQNGKPFPCP